jgi:hypothetical protein
VISDKGGLAFGYNATDEGGRERWRGMFKVQTKKKKLLT